MICSDTDIYELDPISNTKAIKVLWCEKTNIDNLNAIVDLNNLEHINISFTQVKDLQPVSNMKKLKVLKAGMTRIKQLEPLSGLDNIEKIYIWGTNIDNLTPLYNLTNLNYLSIPNCKNISSGKISEFRKLKPRCQLIIE